MNRLSAIFLIVFMISTASYASRVISYTGYSAESQEEANNAAMAGIAKQIATQVSTSQKLTKRETKQGASSSFNKNLAVSNQVQSNVFLKGIRVTPKPKEGKKFVAFASIDLDELSSDLRLKIQNNQKDVKQAETEIIKLINQKRYADALEALAALKTLVLKHPALIASLADFYPLDSSFNLSSYEKELEERVIEKLKHVSLSVKDTKEYEITTPTLPSFTVYVSDEQGPIPNFPVFVIQSGKTLGERYTKEAGEVSFSLKNVNFERGPFTVEISANLPPAVLKKSGLDKNLEINYKTKKNKCSYFLSCNEAINICNIIERRLAQNSFFHDDKNKSNVIEVKMSSDIKKSMQAGRNKIISYEIALQLKGRQIHFLKKEKVVAKTEYDAVTKVLKTIDLSDFYSQADFLCKE